MIVSSAQHICSGRLEGQLWIYIVNGNRIFQSRPSLFSTVVRKVYLISYIPITPMNLAKNIPAMENSFGRLQGMIG